MTQAPRPGTQGYSAEAPHLLKLYEERPFTEAHPGIVERIPPAPLNVLDIGAGTGRDAAWFAARGDQVIAVEPTREMRDGAIALHPAPNITWIDDGFPDLTSVRGKTFDLVWMSAVWMHFDASERAAMFPNVAALVAPRGALMISLRHGSIPPGRRMFDVSGEETVARAAQAGLACAYSGYGQSRRDPTAHWTRLWLVRE
ncbi:MAG: class I SAM-dependent methyltransferase [Terricaulis sp.]